MGRKPLPYGCGSVAALLALSPIAAVGAGAGGFDRAIESALPRVVKLYGLGVGEQAGYGSGVLVSEDGHVLTVFSLLIDARRVRAVTADGTPYKADVVYRDAKRQLALLKLGPDVEGGARREEATVGPFPYFDLSRESSLAPGDWVLAAGNAFQVAYGAEPVSLAHGIISARTRLDARRRLKDFSYRDEVLVIDAITSNPGAPGSAVVNVSGEFVGMIGRVVTSNRTHTNFNYAMPRDVLYEFFREATAPPDGTAPPGGGSVTVGMTAGATSPPGDVSRFDPGIRVARLGYQTVLPFVERVRFGSPGQRAGVRKDDLILSMNGRAVPDADAYEERLAALGSDEPIDLVLRRGETVLTVRIERKP